MGFRFYRRLRLFPGVRVNLSKRGASLSLGRKGAWFTVGPRGTHETVALPGTGLVLHLDAVAAPRRPYGRCSASYSGLTARPCRACGAVACRAGDRRRGVLDVAALNLATSVLPGSLSVRFPRTRGSSFATVSVCSPPARPREHSKELSSAADAAHGAPIVSGFLGGEHCLVDCAKLHFPALPI
jgi:hypothetical protein